jgi:hypothetical protein
MVTLFRSCAVLSWAAREPWRTRMCTQVVGFIFASGFLFQRSLISQWHLRCRHLGDPRDDLFLSERNRIWDHASGLWLNGYLNLGRRCGEFRSTGGPICLGLYGWEEKRGQEYNHAPLPPLVGESFIVFENCQFGSVSIATNGDGVATMSRGIDATSFRYHGVSADRVRACLARGPSPPCEMTVRSDRHDSSGRLIQIWARSISWFHRDSNEGLPQIDPP